MRYDFTDHEWAAIKPMLPLWWKVRPYLLPPLGPSLLPQSLQRQFHCKDREGLCTPEKVAWLLPRLGA
jgi:hypothetical protein